MAREEMTQEEEEDRKVHAALSRAEEQLETAIKEQETAVHRILGLAERLYETAPDKDTMLKIEAIMEVCAFQDLTGQRIRKVGRLIKFLRDRKLIEFGDLPQETRAEKPGLTQEQIDALLAAEGAPSKADS